MSVVNVNKILEDARKNNSAIMCFECANYEEAAWCIEAAEEKRNPVIIMLYYDMDFYISIPVFLAMCKTLCDEVSVDVGLIYDHVNEYEKAINAMNLGFSSIMYEAQCDGLQERIEETKRVVEYAHNIGIDVTGDAGENASAQQVKAFVEQTNVDCLIAHVIYEDENNNHGFTEECHWFETNKAYIDFEKLEQIYKSISIPLVLHGAYNVSEEQIKKSIDYGISKVDDGCPFDTQYYKIMKKEFQKEVNCVSAFSLQLNAKEPMKNYISNEISLVSRK